MPNFGFGAPLRNPFHQYALSNMVSTPLSQAFGGDALRQGAFRDINNAQQTWDYLTGDLQNDPGASGSVRDYMKRNMNTYLTRYNAGALGGGGDLGQEGKQFNNFWDYLRNAAGSGEFGQDYWGQSNKQRGDPGAQVISSRFQRGF